MARSQRASRRRKGTLGRVAEAVKQAGKGKADFLKLEDGDIKYVRVLDVGEDFKDAFVHRVPMERDDGSTYHADVPCLDQDGDGTPCPGCKDDLDRRYKFWTNVILRGDPDADDKDDRKDRVVIWSSGITVAKRLDKLDARHGLGTRDLEVEREGSTMKNTKYEIEFADDEAVELTTADRKLTEKKYDLSRYYKPPAFDDFYTPPGERDGEDKGDVGDASLKRNAFKRRRKKEEDEDDRPRRRRSTRSSSSAKEGLKGFGAKSAPKKNQKTNVRRRRG